MPRSDDPDGVPAGGSPSAGSPAVTPVEVRVEPATDLAGVPDGFGRLWVPHRMAYIDGENRPVDDAAGPSCAFCRAPTLTDEQGLVVARGTVAYVLLNLYPYNGGHVLVCPYRHVADYTDLTEDEVVEIAALTRTAMRVLRAVSGPDGFNLGMNQGAVAGAGIAAHLHQHVVPRWAGDANFLPVVGRTRALPELLADVRVRLAAAWPPAPTRTPPPPEPGTAPTGTPAPTAPHDETEG